MGRYIDIAGQTFNNLTAIKPTSERTKGGDVIWMFSCGVCGNTVNAAGYAVRILKINKCCAMNYRKHGFGSHPLIGHWWARRHHCDLYGRYMHEDWYHNAGQFITYIQTIEGWDPRILDVGCKAAFRQLTLIDKGKGYVPGNLRWVKTYN